MKKLLLAIAMLSMGAALAKDEQKYTSDTVIFIIDNEIPMNSVQANVGKYDEKKECQDPKVCIVAQPTSSFKIRRLNVSAKEKSITITKIPSRSENKKSESIAISAKDLDKTAKNFGNLNNPPFTVLVKSSGIQVTDAKRNVLIDFGKLKFK